MREVFNLAQCKRLYTDHSNKQYIHRPERKNNMHKILTDLLETDHLASARRPDQQKKL